MLVVSGTDEGLTSSAKGSRTFEGHSGLAGVVGRKIVFSLLSMLLPAPWSTSTAF